ncbi:hypothetical protein ACIRQY_02940 [Streptomyces sp. NPDC101490]|uniref:hypothetical protein n=1 Tax=Streptomyces sp. NPDC101490 TaxID=3366143 RepID=UPI00382654C9
MNALRGPHRVALWRKVLYVLLMAGVVFGIVFFARAGYAECSAQPEGCTGGGGPGER